MSLIWEKGMSLEDASNAAVVAAVKETFGNVREAAVLLKVSRSLVFRRLRTIFGAEAYKRYLHSLRKQNTVAGKKLRAKREVETRRETRFFDLITEMESSMLPRANKTDLPMGVS